MIGEKYVVRVMAMSDPFTCEAGHDDCAAWVGGPCSESIRYELAAERALKRCDELVELFKAHSTRLLRAYVLDEVLGCLSNGGSEIKFDSYCLSFDDDVTFGELVGEIARRESAS